MLVYDVTDELSFEQLIGWIQRMEEVHVILSTFMCIRIV